MFDNQHSGFPWSHLNPILKLPMHAQSPYEPGSKLLILGIIIPPIGNPRHRYVNPYNWVDDHLLLQGGNGNLDPTPLKINMKPRHDPIQKREKKNTSKTSTFFGVQVSYEKKKKKLLLSIILQLFNRDMYNWFIIIPGFFHCSWQFSSVYHISCWGWPLDVLMIFFVPGTEKTPTQSDLRSNQVGFLGGEAKANTAWHKLQGGPQSPPTNGSSKPLKSRVKTPVTHLLQPFIGVISPFVTGRGSPCVEGSSAESFNNPLCRLLVRVSTFRGIGFIDSASRKKKLRGETISHQIRDRGSAVLMEKKLRVATW